MKKIISILLCLVFTASMLVSCGKDRIGEELDDSMKGYVKDNMTLNLYIIGDDDNDNATVNARIRNYASKKYNTTLNVVYCEEDVYCDTVTAKLNAAKAAIESEATDEDSLKAIAEKPDIFLINSPEMMKNLYENGHLADITEFFYPEIYEQRVEIHPELKNKFHAELIKDCEGLHNQISETLMDASVIYEDIFDETTQKVITHSKHYCVPNNRVIGAYEYLLIHRDTAEAIGYIGSDSQLAALKTWESTADLRTAIEAKGLNVDDYVRIVTGKYEDKAMYENGTYPGDTKKYACNIVSYPEVASIYDTIPAGATNVESVFDSAFAVNKNTDVDRAMEMVYALNTDNTLHNYLHYGVQDTNYTIDLDTGLVNYDQISSENQYYMNPKYTGDMFKLLNNPAWNEENKLNGDKQNDDSRVYTAP